MIEPCTPWADEADLPSHFDRTSIDPATVTLGIRYASGVLFNLFRRRWPGLCSDTYRPGWTAVQYRDWCMWQSNVLRLPARYVRAITSITIDGSVLDPSKYQLRNGRALVRTDGSGWPLEDISNITTPPHLVVAYTWGEEPPAPAQIAASLLGWEFALAWTPPRSGECRLPRRVQAVTRNGVTMQMFDWNAIFEKNRTGIPEVDMLIAAVNYGESSRTVVIDPMRSPRATRARGTAP